MRAMVPDGHGSVVMDDVPDATAGPGEVLVEVGAYSINRGETFLLGAPQPGWRPGKDVAGTVLRSPPGTAFAPGDRVVAHPELSGWAERVAVPANRVASLPDSVSTTDAAALPLAGLTALRLLRVVGSLPGRTILLTGASGGVGHYFVELAAAGGAVVTAVCSTEDRGRRLLELGACRIVSDVSQAAGPFDVVIETIGGDVFGRAWRQLDHRGLFVWMGQASRTPPTIDFFDWTGGSNATLRKFLYSDHETDEAADLATLVRLVAHGRLHPEIGRTDDWSRTSEALDDLVNRRVRGNVVLEVTT
jgi:NADPH:quinone reductase-like Zn-dependent oxidoreductase